MKKKEQVKALWKSCFEDTDEFIELYFDRVYQDENTLTVTDNGQLLSALQMVPYTLLHDGIELPAAYLSGLCTSPIARKKGYMRELMQESFALMEQRGIALAALIPAEPWLFNYYRQMGFTDAFFASSQTITPPTAPLLPPPGLSVVPHEGVNIDHLYSYLDRKLHERSNCLLHTRHQFQTILADLRLDGGQLFVALDEKQQVVGLLFAYPNEQENSCAIVKELLYNTDSIRTLLLQEAVQWSRKPQLTCITPAPPSHGIAQGMVRIIPPLATNRADYQAHTQNRLQLHAHLSLSLMLD